MLTKPDDSTAGDAMPLTDSEGAGPHQEWAANLKRAWNDFERAIADLLGDGCDLDVEEVHRQMDQLRLQRDKENAR